MLCMRKLTPKCPQSVVKHPQFQHLQMLVGKLCLPLILHKGKQVGKTWTIGASRDVIVHASVKGYINKDIFFEYAELWVQYLRRKSRLDKTNIPSVRCTQKPHLQLEVYQAGGGK